MCELSYFPSTQGAPSHNVSSPFATSPVGTSHQLPTSHQPSGQPTMSFNHHPTTSLSTLTWLKNYVEVDFFAHMHFFCTDSKI